MTVGSKQKLCDTEKLNIKIDNHNIEAVSSQKLLGIHIDEKLNWTRHIDHLCATISTRISLLKQLSSHTPENIQKTFLPGLYPPTYRLWVKYVGNNKQYKH